MKKILFVTNRNIITSSGEMRLIKNRAETLYGNYGIATDFVVLSKKNRLSSQKKETIKAGGALDVIGVNYASPFSLLVSCSKMKRIVSHKLAKNEYGALIISGEAMPFFTKCFKKKSKIHVYLDIHGAFEDVLEVANSSSLLKKIALKFLYHIDKTTVRHGLKYCDGIFVVTEFLKDYLKERFYIGKEKLFFIVPCATSTLPLDKTEYDIDREIYRKKYGISDEEIVFLYSGGVSPWQCIGDSIALFRKLAERLNKKAVMLVFSQDVAELKDLIGNDSRIKVDSYSPDELIHALRVGDFAFLLRKNSLTNNVAFPNKFLEYVQSGIQIITTPYVKEIARQVDKYGLGYIYDFNDVPSLIEYIENSLGRGGYEDKLNYVLEKNSFINTTKVFAESFINEHRE